MQIKLLPVAMISSIALSGCGKSAAEQSYLIDCGERYMQGICQCSYDALKEQYGGTKLDFMLNIQSLPPKEAQAMRNSLKSCKQGYIDQGLNESQVLSQR